MVTGLGARGKTRHVVQRRAESPGLPEAGDSPASGIPIEGSTGGLMALLGRLKAARRRRDDERYGSRPWLAADGEIIALQREIFDLPLDSTTSHGAHPARDDEDDVDLSHLGQPGGPPHI